MIPPGQDRDPRVTFPQPNNHMIRQKCRVKSHLETRHGLPGFVDVQTTRGHAFKIVHTRHPLVDRRSESARESLMIETDVTLDTCHEPTNLLLAHLHGPRQSLQGRCVGSHRVKQGARPHDQSAGLRSLESFAAAKERYVRTALVSEVPQVLDWWQLRRGIDD